MPSYRSLSNKAPWLVAALLGLAALGYGVPLKGSWLDPLASRFLSARWGVSIQMREVEIKRWSQVRFGAIEVMKDGQRHISTGAGEISPGLFKTRARAEQVIFYKPFYKDFAKAFLFLDKGGDVWELGSVDVLLSGGRRPVAHFLKLGSGDLRVRGGICFEGGRILKMHALFFLSERLRVKLPDNINKRLLKRGRFGALRLTYQGYKLTVSGQGGPMLKANWKIKT